MRHPHPGRWIAVFGLMLAACADLSEPPADDAGPDGPSLICTSDQLDDDEDEDGIANRLEGCESGRDSDQDEIPDWLDLDSDDDGIADFIERGDEGECVAASDDEPFDPAVWPCDADGDGLADYVDTDADADGLEDADEDINGDGLLGCCIASCDEPRGDQEQDCRIDADGCGPGQRCEDGRCSPSLDYKCSNGETDPRRKDTFDDGTPDTERGTYICRDATEDRPLGRKPLQLQTDETGDWQVALEVSTDYAPLDLGDAADGAAAALLDEEGDYRDVAGFVVSRPTDKADVQGVLDTVIAALISNVPGGSGVATIRALGTNGRTHDRFEAVKGTLVGLRMSLGVPLARVRNELVASLLNRTTLGNVAPDWGEPSTEFVIRFVTVRRFGFAPDPDDPSKLLLDEDGHPQDDGDQSKWRAVVMGAVARKDHYENALRETQPIFDDMSGGTALATAADGLSDECDVATIAAWPVADIIWVIDDSGSMQDNREDVAANAQALFNQANASGLDFRVAVTGTVLAPADPTAPSLQGKFCSDAATADGGDDRFLESDEQATFEACIADPPGSSAGREAGLQSARAAVQRHLPRTADNPAKIRPDAVVAVIIATDEAPQEFKEEGLFPDVSGSPTFIPCNLPADEQTIVDEVTQPFINFFDGKPPDGSAETEAIVHFIGGVCDNTCDAQTGHGYLALARSTSGIIVDVCQSKLSTSLQEIINHVIGASSPAVLEHVPITTSLAVAVGRKQILRSRIDGFDYVASSNALTFFGMPFPKGAQVVTSYRRWAKQAPVK